jgi:hypothetical protein
VDDEDTTMNDGDDKTFENLRSHSQHVIEAGTVVCKWGTSTDSQFNEDGIVTRATVLSITFGVVTLDCGLGNLAWWQNLGPLQDIWIEGEQDSRVRMFCWKDVGVHRVEMASDSKSNKKRRAAQLDGLEKLQAKLVGYFEPILLPQKYVLYQTQPNTPTYKHTPAKTHPNIPVIMHTEYLDD